MVHLREDQRPPGEPAKTPFRDLVAFLGKPSVMDTLFYVGPGSDGGPVRFVDILERSGIPRNTLVKRLKELVELGFLHRTEYDENPPRVEYEVTEKVIDLIPAFKALHAWCDEHYLVPPERGRR